MINLYKTKENTQFIAYSNNIMQFPEFLEIETVKENIDLSDYMNIHVVNYEQLMTTLYTKNSRTSDKILSENHIESFSDLQASYFLIMHKSLNKPKYVRDLIIEKYNTLLEYYNPKINS